MPTIHPLTLRYMHIHLLPKQSHILQHARLVYMLSGLGSEPGLELLLQGFQFVHLEFLSGPADDETLFFVGFGDDVEVNVLDDLDKWALPSARRPLISYR